MPTEQRDHIIQQGADFEYTHEREDISSSLLPDVSAEMKLRSGIGGSVLATWSTANGYITKAAHGSHIDFTILVGGLITADLPAPASGVYDFDITINTGGVVTTMRNAEGSFYITPNI